MMKILFHIDYKTADSETVCVKWCVGQSETTLPLQTTDGYHWSGLSEEIPSAECLSYHYYIGVGAELSPVRTEFPFVRCLENEVANLLSVQDEWTDFPYSKVFFRSAFSDCVFAQTFPKRQIGELRICITSLPRTDGYTLALSGSCSALGCWDEQRAVPLVRSGLYEWKSPALSSCDAFEYKVVLLNEDRTVVQWEEGDNRRFLPSDAPSCLCHVLPRLAPSFWQGAGVVIPVFSLRSERAWGVGDFADLRRFVAWSAKCGMSAVQILPINDTTNTGTWRDTYPYNSISVYALHPLYADLNSLGTDLMRKQYEAERSELNAKTQVDYEAVIRLKERYLRQCFVQKGVKVLRTKEYLDFYAANAFWLFPYAVFRYFSSYFHTADFRMWKEFADYSETALHQFLVNNPVAQNEVDYYCYVQYELHLQLLEVREEARRCGVIIKGDLPIGISRNSVPAWVDGKYFHFDGQAGAPPDDFAVNGQNWGFPTYNWETMAADGYLWWQRRLQHMGHYFDAYRIDHVLGFFRIWEVPSAQRYGVLGHFRPALPLTKEEITSYGFDFSDDCLTPFIFKEDMEQELSSDVCAKVLPYLEDGGGAYRLKSDFCQQRNIEQLPDGDVRTFLMSLACEVLFVPDGERSETYHPRVSAQLTRRFRHLSSEQQTAFNRLHDDFFYVRHNEFWAREALAKLPAVVNASNMLPCAEDLGMVPGSVKGVLEQLQILSLEIQRMPKEYGVRFGDLSHNPYLSVSTIATHDMPPLRLWWAEDHECATAFWQQVLKREGEAPDELDAVTAELIVKLHLQSPSILCLLALQDWLAVSSDLRSNDYRAEQINVPSNPHQNWNYRLPQSLEQLEQATDFNDKLRDLVHASHR